MTTEETDKEAKKLLKECRKMNEEIMEKEKELTLLREAYRSKYTRLNQLAKNIRDNAITN